MRGEIHASGKIHVRFKRRVLFFPPGINDTDILNRFYQYGGVGGGSNKVQYERCGSGVFAILNVSHVKTGLSS